MPDFDNGAVPIADALNALPLDAPPHDAWPALAARIGVRGTTPAAGTPRGSRHRRWIYPLATAAALALALLLPVPHGTDTAPSPVSDTPPSIAGVDLPALKMESARLERLIAAVDADPLQPADALVLGLAFEDELAGIDAALSAAVPGSRDAEALWRRRVDVLSGYAELQSSRRLLAAEGQTFETTLVALH